MQKRDVATFGGAFLAAFVIFMVIFLVVLAWRGARM